MLSFLFPPIVHYVQKNCWTKESISVNLAVKSRSLSKNRPAILRKTNEKSRKRILQ